MRARDRRWLIGVVLRLSLLFGLVSLILTCSYGPRDRGVEPGYVRFSGDLSGVSVRVDGGRRIAVNSTRSTSVLDGRNNGYARPTPNDRGFYKMRPGKHRLVVYRGEHMLTSKEMYLPKQVVADVRVP